MKQVRNKNENKLGLQQVRRHVNIPSTEESMHYKKTRHLC